MKRKLLKTIAAVLVTTMLVGTVTGCGGEKDPGTEAGNNNEKVEIICMVQSSPEAEFVKTVAQSYMEEPGNENITVTINELGRDNVMPRIQNQLFAQSDGVDFFFCTPAIVGALAEGGVLEPLDSYFEKPELIEKGFAKENFTQGGIGAGTYNDQVYGLPFVTSTMLLYYRTDLIDSPPETWEEYREVAEKFTQSVNPDSPTPYGTTVFGKPQQDAINLLEEATILWSKGGETVTADNEIKVNDPIGVETLEYWSDLYRDGLTPPDANAYDYTSILTAFQEGQVAMCIQWDAAAGDFASSEASPKIYDKYAVAMIPGTEQEDGTIFRTPYLNNWLSCMNKFSSHKDETADFLAYLYTPEVFIEHLTPGLTTALTDVLESDEFKASKEDSHSYEAYKDSLEQGRGFVANKNLDKINSILDTALNRTMVGDIEAQEALDQAAKEIEQLQ